jgi:hypothetical protein
MPPNNNPIVKEVMKRSLLTGVLIGALCLGPSPAGAASSLQATALSLPSGTSGVFEGYFPGLSCTSAVNCVAVGTVNQTASGQQGVIVTERAGTWLQGQAIVSPSGTQNTQALNVSCATALSCTVAGTYVTAGQNQSAFVDSENNGVWGTAQTIALPANAALSNENATPHDTSCAGVGTCAVVGTYTTPTGAIEGFTDTEVGGRWGSAVALTLPADHALNPQVTFSQVSCWTAGSCSAVGSYVTTNGVISAFVVPSAKGHWGAAAPLVLPYNASAYSGATLSEITCYPPATCTAIGTFNTVTGQNVPMVATMTNGVWGRATVVALPHNASASAATFLWGYAGISCSALGTCAFGGNYVTAAGQHEGFLATEQNGKWRSATELTLPAGAVDAGPNGGVIAVSCVKGNTCTAGAAYRNAGKNYEALLVTETSGAWNTPQPVTPPTGATTVGVDGGIYGLSCFVGAPCVVTGSYLAPTGHYQAFALQK